MRISSCALTIVILTGIVKQAHPADPPYLAQVTNNDTLERSGPGKAYYPTSLVQQGTQIQVLRHALGGWYAIAPPAQAFSLVERQKITLSDGQTGIANSNNVIVRVGSSLNQNCNMAAGVQLHQGDRVKILEEITLQEDGQLLELYRIQPIRQEERWISGRFIRPISGNTETAGDVSFQKDDPPIDDKLQISLKASDRTLVTSPSRRSSSPSSLSKKRQSDASSPVTKPLDETGTDPARELLNQTDRLATKLKRTRLNQQHIDRLHAMYKRARLLASSTDLHNLISERIHQLLNSSETHERQHGTAHSSPKSDKTTMPIQTAGYERAASGPRQNVRYDGTGYLKRASVRGIGMPAYQLVDANGRIRYYLSPALGVHLKRHVNQHVGVIGNVRYRRELNGFHVTVRHLVEQPINELPHSRKMTASSPSNASRYRYRKPEILSATRRGNDRSRTLRKQRPDSLRK